MIPGRLNQRKVECAQLVDAGVSKSEIFETLATEGLRAKTAACANRCERCWHDKASRCICAHKRTQARRGTRSEPKVNAD